MGVTLEYSIGFNCAIIEYYGKFVSTIPYSGNFEGENFDVFDGIWLSCQNLTRQNFYWAVAIAHESLKIPGNHQKSSVNYFKIPVTIKISPHQISHYTMV